MIPAAHIKPEKVAFALGFRLDKLILRELLELESRQPLLIFENALICLLSTAEEKGKGLALDHYRRHSFSFVQFMLVLSFNSLKRMQGERLH